MQAVAAVGRGGAAFNVVNGGTFIDDDQCAFKLSHVLAIDSEISLQRKLNLHPFRNVDERTA